MEAELSQETMDQIVLQLAGRIDVLIEEEAAILYRGDDLAIDTVLERKEHLALEIGRLTSIGKGCSPDPIARGRLEQTLGRLGHHSELIRRHIEALKHLCATISDLHCEVSSDGTYDNVAHLRQPRR
jgi:hypothetical protein